MQENYKKLYQQKRFLALLLVLMVDIYRYSLSYFIGRQCRFMPTCSQYMIDAIIYHGVLKGVWLGIKRIGRCHPWGGSGYDRVEK